MGTWYRATPNGKKYFRSVLQAGKTIVRSLLIRIAFWHFFIMFVQQSLQMVYKYCCSLGMQMAEFTTYQDLVDIKPGKNYISFTFNGICICSQLMLMEWFVFHIYQMPPLVLMSLLARHSLMDNKEICGAIPK
jgi:hypothetical protein